MPGMAAGRSYPMPKVRGSIRGQGQRLGGATPYLRPGAEAMAAWAQEGLEELSHDEGEEGRQ